MTKLTTTPGQDYDTHAGRFLEMYEQMFPFGAGGPEPVAHAVVYLLESSGDWISGIAMNVSGGLVRGI